MKRGKIEFIGDFLQKAYEKPDWAPSRILGSLSMVHGRLERFVAAGFVKIKGEVPRRRLVLTPKGRQFLEHYRFLRQLPPEGST